MSDFESVKATLQAVADGVNRLEDKIAALKADVAAGRVITQEQLDELGTMASAIGSDIDDESDQG